MEVKNVEGITTSKVDPEEIQEVQENQVEDSISMLLDALEGISGAPSEADLELWRSIHGQFFASSILGDDNIFIWKTLKRNEFKQIAGSGAI